MSDACVISSWHMFMGGIYLAASEHFFLRVHVLEEGKMGKCRDFREYNKGRIVMARQKL